MNFKPQEFTLVIFNGKPNVQLCQVVQSLPAVMIREWPLTERDDQNKQYSKYQDLCDYFRRSLLRFQRYI